MVAGNPRLKAFLEHPAGPFTSAFSVCCAAWRWHVPPSIPAVHFHAPAFKWVRSAGVRLRGSRGSTRRHRSLQFISLANVSDLNRPPEKLSTAQQVAIAATGIIWSRYSMVITPVNWNLFSVNVFMAATGLYQLGRIATAPSAPQEPADDAAQ